MNTIGMSHVLYVIINLKNIIRMDYRVRVMMSRKICIRKIDGEMYTYERTPDGDGSWYIDPINIDYFGDAQTCSEETSIRIQTLQTLAFA
jgi:hypothetical protein